jgi:hypothetical protein
MRLKRDGGQKPFSVLAANHTALQILSTFAA